MAKDGQIYEHEQGQSVNEKPLVIPCPLCRETSTIRSDQKPLYGIDNLCVVCLDQPVKIFLPTCGHACLCLECGNILGGRKKTQSTTNQVVPPQRRDTIPTSLSQTGPTGLRGPTGLQPREGGQANQSVEQSTRTFGRIKLRSGETAPIRINGP